MEVVLRFCRRLTFALGGGSVCLSQHKMAAMRQISPISRRFRSPAGSRLGGVSVWPWLNGGPPERPVCSLHNEMSCSG